MAAVLESVIVPRSSGFRKSISASATSSPVVALSSSRRLGSFPECRGLRIQLRSPEITLSMERSRNGRIVRRGGIVCEAQETAVHVVAVTEETWQSLVLESDLPVMVEFWASWCGPCRMIHPVIDELSKQYIGKLKCYKLNTDDSPSIATQYGIRSIPTVIIFKNGEKKDAIIGAVPINTLAASIEKFL